MMDKIGFKVSASTALTEIDSFANEDTGMEGTLYRDEHGALIAGICSDAVGLVIYWRLTQDDWDKMRDATA